MVSPNVGVPFHAANLRPFGAPPSKGRREKEGRMCAANESTLSTADAVPLPHAGKAYKVSQSSVIPLISGEWIVSHVWHEILRLSPHLFWLGLFTHRAFSSAQDDDTGGADGLLSGRYVACFGTSGVKDYVRRSDFLERHPDRSGGSFVVWRRLRRLFRRGYPRIVAFPSRGRCPAGADRAQAA